ncbi:hypothetical protein ANN_19925 [Periplaneta americana]|uniref:Uncharacterized protein n=1 Tax=Periplaneta americana TaxID=6978 RepID=A0ABQ8SBG7_PERAM|nr:hypothetical protein ANN_19925 [Periplaneta americana]
MIMSRDENIIRNRNIKIGNLSFEEVEKFKYLGAKVTNINDTQDEIKHRINMGNACYYSVEKSQHQVDKLHNKFSTLYYEKDSWKLMNILQINYVTTVFCELFAQLLTVFNHRCGHCNHDSTKAGRHVMIRLCAEEGKQFPFPDAVNGYVFPNSSHSCHYRRYRTYRVNRLEFFVLHSSGVEGKMNVLCNRHFSIHISNKYRTEEEEEEEEGEEDIGNLLFAGAEVLLADSEDDLLFIRITSLCI